MYHQARTCSSALTASRTLSSLRLPRVGARTLASAIASRGGFRAGPFGSGVGTASLIARIVGEGPGTTPRSTFSVVRAPVPLPAQLFGGTATACRDRVDEKVQATGSGTGALCWIRLIGSAADGPGAGARSRV